MVQLVRYLFGSFLGFFSIILQKYDDEAFLALDDEVVSAEPLFNEVFADAEYFCLQMLPFRPRAFADQIKIDDLELPQINITLS